MDVILSVHVGNRALTMPHTFPTICTAAEGRLWREVNITGGAPCAASTKMEVN